MDHLFLYFLVFFALIGLALSYTRIARYFNIVDIPNHRSSHSTPVIRGGGILFYFAALLFFILSGFQEPWFIGGLSILAIISFTDDLLTLSAKLRLPFQFLAIFFILQASQLLHLPFWALILISVIAVGFINVYNFMDGINGITGLYSLAVLHGFWIISSLLGDFGNNDLLIFSGFALLVFGFFNFRTHARFFAGDVGSVSIAAIIFFLGLKLTLITHSPLILALVLVYLVDGGYTILRRLVIKENIFKPHRRHLYQRLVDIKGVSHMKVASGYAFFQLLINHVVYISFSLDVFSQIFIFGSLFVLTSVLYFVLLKKVEGNKQEKLTVD